MVWGAISAQVTGGYGSTSARCGAAVGVLMVLIVPNQQNRRWVYLKYKRERSIWVLHAR